MSVPSNVSPARIRAKRVILFAQREGFDAMFYDCKCISLELALANFSPVITRLWQKENDTLEIPQISASFPAKH